MAKMFYTIEEVARKVGKKVRIPGFRKGRAPISVVRKSFKAELDQEFLETVVPRALGQALDETGLDPTLLELELSEGPGGSGPGSDSGGGQADTLNQGPSADAGVDRTVTEGNDQNVKIPHSFL